MASTLLGDLKSDPNADQNNRIRPLPPDITAKIKSSVAITSLNSVVLGLLENSLDASATRVEITLDLVRGACTVDDDGFGIAPAEFAASGGLGRMHC
jgi:DNA mismatch repair protein MLH3